MAEEGIIQWGRRPQAVHMADKSLRVNIAVNDRILLHLLEQDHLADRYIVTAGITRPGIAEACALHPPNVSRAMRDLLRADPDRIVARHGAMGARLLKLARGEDPALEATMVKDLGNSYEQAIPQLVQAAADLGDTDAATLRDICFYLLQVSPSFSLRGGTREIMNEIICKTRGY